MSLRREILRASGIALALTVVAILVTTGTRHTAGATLVIHSVLCLVLAASIGFQYGRLGRWFFAVLYVFWALADLGWSISYFFLNLESHSPSAIALTEIPYCIAFLSAVVILLATIEKPLPLFFRNKVSFLALVVTAPVAGRLIIEPFFRTGTPAISSFNVTEITAITISCILLFLAIVAMVSSRSFKWSQFSAGMVCLVFGDWAMRLDVLLARQAQFGLPSFLVLFGLYFSGFALLFDDCRENSISRFDSSSLASAFKLWMLLVMFGFLGLYCMADLGSLEALRTLAIATCFGSLTAVFGGEIFIGRIRWVSERMGSLLKIDAEQQPVSVPVGDDSLPLELRDTYDMVFLRVLQDLKLREEKKRVEERREILSQAAHDIRSPLAALLTVNKDLGELPESKRILVRTAVTRIQDIANNFLLGDTSTQNDEDQEQGEEKTQTVLLASFIDTLISEKRAQYRSRMNIDISTKFDRAAYSLFAQIPPLKLKRVVSNLINNSVEAIEGDGEVAVMLEASGRGMSRIVVRDNGKGIPPELLPKLGEKGATFGKAGGTGRGFAPARQAIRSLGGDISVQSEVGHGTAVKAIVDKATGRKNER